MKQMAVSVNQSFARPKIAVPAHEPRVTTEGSTRSFIAVSAGQSVEVSNRAVSDQDLQSQKRSEGITHLFWFVLSLVLVHLVGCGPTEQPPEKGASNEPSTAARQAPLNDSTIANIKNFCGDCHPFPQPETFPKDHWEEEVIQGYSFYISSRRTDLTEPSREDTIRYYVERAPAVVEVPRADARPDSDPSGDFARLEIEMPTLQESVSLSHIIVAPTHSEIFTADMRRGGIHRWTFNEDLTELTSDEIGKGNHSCRLTPCDWNQDGLEDLLVGEIGSYGVGDHSRGRVSLLLSNADNTFQQILLAENLARVVECAPIDFEGDGDLDILVAEFGWMKTGALKLLRNNSTGTPNQNTGLPSQLSTSQFTTEVIDERHGALGVRVVDIDQDGQEDFVVAYGQEYESLEVWYGEGNGKYRHEIIMQLPDPSYNSSSFDIVDIDQDGRLDIVHTNGDTLDAFLPKPYHGVRWLRNTESGAWERRELGLLIGALQSVVADFDQDGDLDIAAVGMYPQAIRDPGAYDSICWWEQRENLEFVQHTIERDRLDYATLVSRDINNDGLPDLVLGNWTVGPGEPRLRIFLAQPKVVAR